jgi:hypothetical protein
MRTVALISLLLCLGTPTVVHGEPRRIVFCAKRSGVCAHASVLGKTEDGFWAAVDNRELQASKGRLPAVLYVHAEELTAALEGLDDEDKKDAIEQRLKVASESLVSDALADDLLSVAGALSDAPLGKLGKVLDAAVVIEDRPRLADMAAEGANEAADASSMVLDELMELMADLPAGPLAKSYGKMAATLARLNRPPGVENNEDPDLFPFAESKAVYFVPSSEGLNIRALQETDQFPQPWKGGLVLILSPDDLDKVPFKGQALRKLYLDSRLYVSDVELTRAQLHRRLETRLRAIPPGEHGELVASKAFELAKRFHQLAPSVRKAPPSWRAEWHKAAAMADQNLRVALAAARPDAAKNRARRLATLRADLGLAVLQLRGSPSIRGVKRAQAILEQLDR